MSAIAEILEQELEEAVEVKNKKSLHRYIVLLTENIVRKENYEKDQNEIKSGIKTLAEIVKQGFERMDKRFEDMNKKQSMMLTFMNLGFGIIILLTVLFKFIV